MKESIDLVQPIISIASVAILATFAQFIVACSIPSNCSGRRPNYQEQFRPQFHYSPPEHWANDPNGLVYYKGMYHLFYQFNPYGSRWGHLSWGHAVSRDLVHWKTLPVAIKESDGIMIFSGSAVVDRKNTSGFGKNGKPPLVAIYTGYDSMAHIQTQDIAYSNDRGSTWTKYKGNPVIDIHSENFRDPKVFWCSLSNSWIMVVSLATEHRMSFYQSEDLKHWTHLSYFGPISTTDGVWECPDLFQLPVSNEADIMKWVLSVNVGSGAPAGGGGNQYFVGTFDGRNFTAEEPLPARTLPPAEEVLGDFEARHHALWSDFGKDFYAAVTWNGIRRKDGRKIWIGWMNNWKYSEDLPTHPWRGAQSIPRVLSLEKTGHGYRLIQQPMAGLEKLREGEIGLAENVVEPGHPVDLTGALGPGQLELIATFQFPGNSEAEFGIRVMKGISEETLIGYNCDSRQLFVDRSQSGTVNFSSDFPGRHSVRMMPVDDCVSIHAFIDRSSVEVFGNHGKRVITDRIFPHSGSEGIEVYSVNGTITLKSFRGWRLRSIWGKRR